MGSATSTQILPPQLEDRHPGKENHLTILGKPSSHYSKRDLKNPLKKAEITIKAFTWNRDSHGLYDYESKSVNTTQVKSKQSNNYWIYHKNVVEDADEEKLAPADKAWLAVKYLNNAYQSKSYKIKIGDTLKFGRVRFKVIMMSNEYDGQQEYKHKISKKKTLLSRGSMENTVSDNDMEQFDNDFDNNQQQPVLSLVRPGVISQSQQFNSNSHRDPEQRNSSQLITQRNSTFKNPEKIQRKETINSQQTICRICLGDENMTENPLISPCKCAGTMKHIHIDCLREWLNSKSSFKENSLVKTYCWKTIECELCKVKFPDRVSVNNGKVVDLVSFEKPEADYIILESVTQQNIRIIHILDMSTDEVIKVGRGHDAQVRITDISVSRFHAAIKKTCRGDFVVQDNDSKFGTLVLVRKPYMLQKTQTNYVQLGRTLLEIGIQDPNKNCSMRNCCFKNKVKTQKSTLAFDGEDYFPEEFLQRHNEQTREEEHNANIQKKTSNQIRIRVDEPSQQRSQALNISEELQAHNEGNQEERRQSVQIIDEENQIRSATALRGLQDHRQSVAVFEVDNDNERDNIVNYQPVQQNEVQDIFQTISNPNLQIQLGFQNIDDHYQNNEELKDELCNTQQKMVISKSQGRLRILKNLGSQESFNNNKSMKSIKELSKTFSKGQLGITEKKDSSRMSQDSIQTNQYQYQHNVWLEQTSIPVHQFYLPHTSLADENLNQSQLQSLHQDVNDISNNTNQYLDISQADSSSQQIFQDSFKDPHMMLRASNYLQMHQDIKTSNVTELLDSNLISQQNTVDHNNPIYIQKEEIHQSSNEQSFQNNFIDFNMLEGVQQYAVQDQLQIKSYMSPLPEDSFAISNQHKVLIIDNSNFDEESKEENSSRVQNAAQSLHIDDDFEDDEDEDNQ